ncbi:RHS repeat-associated core domain-containing protein [Longispora sp. K20-0274]|uniref:RHS repeat domain-containing protein n=1 Tax=Longispora sp. K20-0274 TaxID=3088255 RepID=UPI00399A5FCE
MRNTALPRARRLVLASLAGTLLITALSGVPAIADPPHRLKTQQERLATSRPVAPVKAQPDPMAGAIDSERRRVKHPAVTLPTAGRATVTLAQPEQQGAGAALAAPLPVRATGLPVTVEPVTKGLRAPTGQVTVELLDGKQRRPGELLVKVGAQAGPLRVGIDYSAFRDLYGGDWTSRLRLVSVPDCALTRPTDAACQPTEVPSRNDGKKVTTELAASAAPRMLALTAGASGAAGTLTASTLSQSSSWSGGGSGGDFNWSYPMRVPPTGSGPQPSVGLSYSSQSVDGRNAASNNQPSWIGSGFEYSPGSIERRYRPCSEDMAPKDGHPATNTVKTGDLCWATDNAVMSLGGHSVELIRDDSTGAWHPKADDNSKVERRTDTVNGDNDNEYWKITVPDGTQYFFGRNRLPNWVSGKPETNSTWTVPVYGNHPGEPCDTVGWCQQAWKWNLDHVVDIYGNSMSYWYTKETNYYARNQTDAAATQYVRGGTLDRIDYGTRADTEFGTAPAQVLFDTDVRCEANCTANSSWVDTPKDQDCAGTNCAGRYSPTFWTTKRLSKVRTQYWTGSAYQPVESWTLRHTYPDPDPDANIKGALWLSGITHSAGGVNLPELTITGEARDNRVDRGADDHSPAMMWYRISKIVSETGGETAVWYKPEDCVLGSRMPSAPESNNLRCYPVRWIPQGYDHEVTDYYHKYVVDSVATTDKTAGAGGVLTQYEYVGDPAWHYTDDDGLIDADHKTWSQWRGYGTVKVWVGGGTTQTQDERTLSATTYFRGMNGDHLPTGTRNVSVTDSLGGTWPDDDEFSGMAREQLTYNTLDNSVVGAVITDPWKSDPPSATRTISGTTVTARHLGVKATHSRTVLDGNRGWRKADSQTWNDDTYGMVDKTETQASQVNAAGVVTATGAASCNKITYSRNTGAAWLLLGVSRVESYALPCATAPTVADDVLGDTRFSFDNQAPGLAPIQGNVTQVEDLKSWTVGNPVRTVVSTTKYDNRGRQIEVVDAIGAKTTTAYTALTNGPVNRTTSTNHLQLTTSADLDPAWGVTKLSTDPNGKRTESSYDAFGRLTGVWLPGRSKAANPSTPNTGYEYKLYNDRPSVVISKRLTANDTYVTTYTLYDSLLRQRQTQTPATGLTAGRVLTDSYYDSVGRPSKSNAAYALSGTAGEQLSTTADNQVDGQHIIEYDRAGRAKASVYRSGVLNQEKWRTATYQAGDRTDTNPPTGGTPTSSVTDVEGRLTELRFHRATGDETIKYTYNRRGDLATVTDPTGQNVWTYGYDQRGRLTSTTDPDRGTTTSAYNDAGQLTTVTDQLQRVLAYEYDSIGRPKAVHDNSLTGPKRTEWGYDGAAFADSTQAKGLPSSATRWIGTNAYTTRIDTYDDGYRPLKASVVIPANETGLTGTYTTDSTYKSDGSPATTTLPAVTGLAKEVLNHNYDDFGQPTKLFSTKAGYVLGNTYTAFGESSVRTYDTGVVNAPKAQQSWTYEAGTRRLINSQVTRDASPSMLADRNYQYDDVGKLKRLADTPAGGQADVQCFRHDDMQRLTEAWTPGNGDCAPNPTVGALDSSTASYWLSWEYLPNGNRKTQTDHKTAAGVATTTYGYPANGATQPHTLSSTSVTDNNGTRNASYQYDVFGNTTQRPNGAGGTQALGWDVEGHLSTIDGKADSYVYDADGSRLIKHEANGDATLYLGATELRYTKSTNAVTSTRYYSFAGDTVAVRTSAGVTWMASDHQGTSQVSIAVNASQTATVRRQTPYGTPRGSAVSWVGNRGFLDGSQDAAGLTHLGARDYDPGIGRFISVDPVFDGSSPQQINGYAYGDNAPTDRPDPTGLHTQAFSDDCNPTDHSVCFQAKDTSGKSYGQQTDDMYHELNDFGSNLPWVGAVFDASNAIQYAVEGDWGSAAEYAGWTALDTLPVGKWLGKGAKFAGKKILKVIAKDGVKIAEKTIVKATEDAAETAFGAVEDERKAQRAAANAAAEEKKAAEAAAAAKKADEVPEPKAPDGGGSTDFYTVQGPDDAARLGSGGHPFPTEPHRAHFGPGVYAWGNEADALGYAANKPGALIMRISIDNKVLAGFKQISLVGKSDEFATSFMEANSLLWGGNASHGLDYISRPVSGQRVEHYFSSKVFHHLRF